ncbi:MAG: hypothetical protein HC828_22725 [Blastochloris sp.]|nr:hypothetical protein [Blastochloris sp.]
MLAASGDLDTRLYLVDNIGNLVAYADDDFVTGTIDAVIGEFIIPHDGYFTIIATRYLIDENAGDYRLKLSLDAPAESDDDVPVFAPFNIYNSRGLRGDGTFFITMSAGDNIVDGTEVRVQTLISFALPPRIDGAAPVEIDSALFDIRPCYEAGGWVRGAWPDDGLPRPIRFAVRYQQLPAAKQRRAHCWYTQWLWFARPDRRGADSLRRRRDSVSGAADLP